MRRPRSETLLHGLIGGMAAGAVVAVWFLVLDLVTADAFHSPVLLARTILGPGSEAVGSGRLLVGYTVLHFLVFGALGVAAATTLARLDVQPAVFVGVIAGIIVPTSVVYISVLATGANVLNVLPAPHVLGANALGGVVMMTYLHRATRAPAGFGPGMLRHHPLIAEGFRTGLIGAAAVALWFLLLDIMAGRPFFTPAALGSALLLDATSAAEVQVTVGVVGAYTLFHLGVFLGLGLVASTSANLLERGPSWWLIWLLAFIVVEGLFFGSVGSVAGWLLGELSWWAIGLGNLIAVAAMGWWTWIRHPRLSHRLREVADTRT